MKTGKLATLHPFMPWTLYSNMRDEELTAIFAYLRTLRPVGHVVTNGPSPTRCSVCGLEHGGGDRN